MSTRFSQSMEVSRLTRDGTAETVSRDQILRRERGQGKVHFPCPADHVQDGQPYTVDPYNCYMLLLLLLLLFLTFSALVANPKKLLYTVANPALSLLNREKKKKKKVWQRPPSPPSPRALFVRRK